MSTPVPSAAQDEWGAVRSRTVSWYDPAIFSTAAELSGREMLQAIIDGRLPPPPIANLIGAELVSAGDGEAVFRCHPDESMYNPLGVVHGGLLATLLDTASGCAVQSLLPPGVGLTSIELKVSFMKALRADTGEIEARGRSLRIGRAVAFAEAHARDRDGELVGHVTASLAVLGA